MDKTFVTLTKREFDAILTGDWEEANVPGVKEVVYDIGTDNQNVNIRLYSTVDIRTGETRGIGQDAIRVVYWDAKNNRPLGKGKKILRVEGATTIKQRIQTRIQEFMDSAYDQDVVDFKYVEAILKINGSKFAMGMLSETLLPRGFLTDKQLAYVIGDVSPKGWPTFEANIKKKGQEAQLNQLYTEIMEADDVDLQTKTSPDIREPIKGQTENIQLDQKEKENGKINEVPQRSDVTFIKDDGRDNLIPTSEHVDYKYPFEYFNRVQSMVFPHAELDENWVLSFQTSSGKTICAELVMDHVFANVSSALGKGVKVLVSSPLKALTQEHHDKWVKRFPGKQISILTGDYALSEKRKTELAKADLIVLTSEMLDSRTRRMKSEQGYWLLQVALLIVDEAHILTTNRGHAVETGLMRFTSINQNARVVFLSATMPNVYQLGEWLSDLNGKPTKVFSSSWRPTKLIMHYLKYEAVFRSYWTTQNNKMDMAVDTTIDRCKEGQKVLIFVHDKGTGRTMVSKLKDVGIESAFHNANLKLKIRLEIEKSFTGKENGLKVLVSTSTLAWGRNLPARNVVIVGVHRGITEVDMLDILQMAGRSGRYFIPKYVIKSNDNTTIRGMITTNIIEGTPKKVVNL